MSARYRVAGADPDKNGAFVLYGIVTGRFVLFNHFAGDGQWFGNEQTKDSAVVARCRAAFESAAELGTPHTEYHPALK
ncbi:DUF6879 family protein [Nocardia pseudovaccinii]|uniref:DUF6879 family protein n=1 Tax=Nocardia pseudovaccinii TaxID=189540 RepID=UPI0007A4F76A|nr:DUF6879 family protein [Nocardia pseudovaccinii]